MFKTTSPPHWDRFPADVTLWSNCIDMQKLHHSYLFPNFYAIQTSWCVALFWKPIKPLLLKLVYEGWKINPYQLCFTESPENKLSQMFVNVDSMHYTAFLNIEWILFSKKGVLIIWHNSCCFQYCILLIWNKVTKCPQNQRILLNVTYGPKFKMFLFKIKYPRPFCNLRRKINFKNRLINNL